MQHADFSLTVFVTFHFNATCDIEAIERKDIVAKQN